MTEDQMLNDLSLRGWIATGDYLYKRKSPMQVWVCMMSVYKTCYIITSIPYSRMEQAQNSQVPWTAAAEVLAAAHATVIEWERDNADDDA